MTFKHLLLLSDCVS